MQTMNLKRIISGVIIAALASVLVYAALAFLTDAPRVAATLRSFPLTVFGVFIALSTLSFWIRGLRWGALMRLIGHPVSHKDAVYLQLTGQTMALTPGRVGEMLKPWLARNIAEMPMTRGLALVFSERLADLIGVGVLALGGLSVIGGNTWILLAGLGAILIGTGIASSQWFHDIALRFIGRQEFSRRHHGSAVAIASTIKRSLTWSTMLWSVAVSAVAWGLEGVGLWLCLDALGFNGLSVLAAVSVYAISMIAGAFTFLPGGIGLTEASITGILIASGMDPSSASATTLITRVATLWWGVAIGWIALAIRPSLFRAMLAYSTDTENGPD